MTESELEDALARLEGIVSAQAMIINALAAAIPPQNKSFALGVLETQDARWRKLAQTPGSLRSETVTESAEKHISLFKETQGRLEAIFGTVPR